MVRRAGGVGMWVLLSRVSGLIRDGVRSHFFGASHATDAANLQSQMMLQRAKNG